MNRTYTNVSLGYEITPNNGSQLQLHPKYTVVEAALIGTVLSFIIFLSIAGNILVCVAILTDRTLRRKSNYFLVSLAIADLLVSALVMTFAVANDILGYWIFGDIFCNVWLSFDVMCSTASILNLCAVSLDRYLHVRNPLRYDTWMTTRRVILAISVVWACSTLISFLPIHLGWHKTQHNVQASMQPKTFQCLMALNPMYAVVSSIVSFYIPCLVMILIYIKLYQYARKHVQSIKKTWTPGLNDNSPANKQAQYKVSDHKAAVTLGVIMGSFLFCWVPFFTINIVGAFCGTCIPTIVFTVFTWLGYLNSCLNPIIYSIFNREFREAFKRVLSINRCLKSDPLNYGVSFKNDETLVVEYGTVKSKDGHSKLLPQGASKV